MLAVACHIKKKSLESNLKLQEVKKQRILENIDSQISKINSMKEEPEKFDYNSDSTVLFEDSDDGGCELDESIPIMEALKSKTKNKLQISLGETKIQEPELVEDQPSMEIHGSDSSKENSPANFSNQKRTRPSENDGNKKKVQVPGPARQKKPVTSTPNSDTNESCELCTKSFDKLSLFERHLKTEHGLKRSFECKICHRLFFTNYLRKRHFQKLHKNRYKCGVCHELFQNEYLLEVHAQLKHSKINKRKFQGQVNLVKVEN